MQPTTVRIARHLARGAVPVVAAWTLVLASAALAPSASGALLVHRPTRPPRPAHDTNGAPR